MLAQLHARLDSDAQGSEQIRVQVARLEALLTQKSDERTRVVALYRRGRLSDADLDAQMDEIGREETALETHVSELRGRLTSSEVIATTISSAQMLLARLRTRLDEPISWELKRRLVEVLVAGVRVETVEECGVKQSRSTVTYRFNELDQAMPVVLPQSYSAPKVARIPAKPKSVGDHIRRRRLSLKLLQKDVAGQIGVDKTSIANWEANRSAPNIRHMHAIIDFIGYDPLPQAIMLAEKLVRQRTGLGLSQKDAATRIGVDAGTLARWERGERKPTTTCIKRVEQFLCGNSEFGADAAKREIA